MEISKMLLLSVFKKGSRTNASNYQPVSLTSVCCKTMEKLISDALIKHMVDNDFLKDCQHGFVKGCSCTTQSLEVVDKLCGLLDIGDTVDMVYSDFAKAFDSVLHRRLLFKFQQYGITGPLLDWIVFSLIKDAESWCWRCDVFLGGGPQWSAARLGVRTDSVYLLY